MMRNGTDRKSGKTGAILSAVVVIVAMAAAGFRSIMVMCLLSVFTEPLLYIIRCICCHFSTSFVIIYLSYQFSRL